MRKTSIFGNFGSKWPILEVVWPNGQNEIFSKKRKRSFLLQRLGLVKIYQILMNGLRKNAKNLHFWAFWAKMANVGKFLAKMAKKVKIIKNGLRTFFSHLQALTMCKVSEKSNERFPRKRVTDERTYARTYVRTRPLRSQTTVGRETNKVGKTSFFSLFKRIKVD